MRREWLPLVSVVIPAFMAASFIEETLRSVAGQRYRPIEVVVVEDYSPDETAKIVQELIPELASHGLALRLLRQPSNLGGAAALKRGFSEAAGDYICWLSADDAFVDPTKTSRQVRALGSGEGMSFCRRSLVGPALGDAVPVAGHWSQRFPGVDVLFDIFPSWRLTGLLFMNVINGSSVMIARRSIDRCGTFDPELGSIDQDGDLWMRFSALGMQFHAVDIEGAFYRVHPGQTTHQTGAVARGTTVTRVRMIMALEESSVLASVLRRSWPVLILAARGQHRALPAVGQYLCVAASGLKVGLFARLSLRRLERALRSEGLWDAAAGEDAAVGDCAHMESDEFRVFRALLGRRGAGR